MTYELIAEDDKVKVLLEDHPEILKTLQELGIKEIKKNTTVKDLAEIINEDIDIIIARLNIAVFGVPEEEGEDLNKNMFTFEEE